MRALISQQGGEEWIDTGRRGFKDEEPPDLSKKGLAWVPVTEGAKPEIDTDHQRHVRSVSVTASGVTVNHEIEARPLADIHDAVDAIAEGLIDDALGSQRAINACLTTAVILHDRTLLGMLAANDGEYGNLRALAAWWQDVEQRRAELKAAVENGEKPDIRNGWPTQQ